MPLSFELDPSNPRSNDVEFSEAGSFFFCPESKLEDFLSFLFGKDVLHPLNPSRTDAPISNP